MQEGTAALESRTADTTDSLQTKDQAANDAVNRYAAWAAAAGVIPIPMMDIVAVSGLQLQMLRRIADIYEVPFTDNIGKSVIAAMLGGILPASAASATAMGILSVLKFVPLIGTTLASMSMPALSAAATYAIGKVFVQHFASGGTLLDFNPQDYREFMKSQAEKARTKDFSRNTPAPSV